MQQFIIKLVCCLGWLSAIAFGQFQLSESVSGAVSFPDLMITCLGNLAVFYSSILRGGLYLEMGAKDALTMITGRIKLKKIKGLDINCFGQTTCREENLSDCSVLMLSRETPSCSMKQFVEYNANVYHVWSVLVQYFPFESVPLTVEICTCLLRERDHSFDNSRCGCIVLGVNEVITTMLAQQIPRTLKRLPNDLCLLPSLECLKNGCHGCNSGLLHVEETDVFSVEETDELLVEDIGTKKTLREGDSKMDCPAAVCRAPYSTILKEPATCICIPVRQEGNDRNTDRWTELLIGSFKSKDYETRGAIIRREISSVSDDLENYLAGSGKCYAVEEYSLLSLIVPRSVEILINLGVTFWFKVDGFSSALVARRAVRDYIVDNTTRGFAAHVFIAKAEAQSNDNHSNVYQLLSFRGNLWNPRALSVIVGFVNLACSITWAVLVALEGDSNKWYHTHSRLPSKARLVVIFVAIAIVLGMDCVDLCLYLPYARSNFKGWLDFSLYLLNVRSNFKGSLNRRRKTWILCTMIVFEILCIVSCTVVSRALGIKTFGRWVYGAVQGLVWVKWATGSYLLGQYIPRQRSPTARPHGSTGMYMYSSSFFLNAILAGARAKWDFS